MLFNGIPLPAPGPLDVSVYRNNNLLGSYTIHACTVGPVEAKQIELPDGAQPKAPNARPKKKRKRHK
jgi:hypothetical protein